MLKKILAGASAAFFLAGSFVSVGHAETVKMAFIGGLSGPFAGNGQGGLNQAKFAIETFVNGENGVDGLDIELLELDGQENPTESLVQLKSAISQGATYILQGGSSSVANALIDAIDKHNRRNPDKRVLFLNFSAADPSLTNDNCSFWHFRFQPHADMQVNAMTEAIKADPDAKRVYVIGQDYSYGKAVSAAARKFLAEKRPDIEIVGDVLHPIGKVKDFTPYVQKIQQSGADAIITGNWGSDIVNLVKSVTELGVDAKMYTIAAAGLGITGSIGEAGKGKVFLVQEGHGNPPQTEEWGSYLDAVADKYPHNLLYMPRMAAIMQMFTRAVEEVGSTEPQAVARALEGMEHITLAGDETVMRAQDHQLIMPVSLTAHTDEGIEYGIEDGYGLLTVATFPRDSIATETTCEMERPS